MNKKEWLSYAATHREVLSSLLRNYHPANLKRGSIQVAITAPNAEKACEVVREQIRRNHEGNPELMFKQALLDDDVATIYKVLNQAWFGVPESTSCWSIDGFREAVTLLEEIPENE